jgi:hypothetical protein
MTEATIVEYRTLQIPTPEGKAALIFPERISEATAQMLIDIVTAQLNRMAKYEDVPQTQPYNPYANDTITVTPADEGGATVVIDAPLVRAE